jgi:hypothetical protein
MLILIHCSLGNFPSQPEVENTIAIVILTG